MLDAAAVTCCRNVNLKVFHTLCNRYGLNLSEEATVGLVRHFENFKCAS